MFFKKFGDVVVGVFFMILGIVLIVAAMALPKSKVMDIGPDFMPTVIGGLMFVLAAVLAVQGFLGLKDKKDIDPASLPKCDYKRVGLSVLLVLIYVFTMQPVGFIPTSLVFLLLMMLVLAPDDKRKPKDIILLLVIDVIFTFAVYFLFRNAFMIILPPGILRGIL